MYVLLVVTLTVIVLKYLLVSNGVLSVMILLIYKMPMLSVANLGVQECINFIIMLIMDRVQHLYYWIIWCALVMKIKLLIARPIWLGYTTVCIPKMPLFFVPFEASSSSSA